MATTKTKRRMALRCEDEEEELGGWRCVRRCGVSGMCTIPALMYQSKTLTFVCSDKLPGHGRTCIRCLYIRTSRRRSRRVCRILPHRVRVITRRRRRIFRSEARSRLSCACRVVVYRVQKRVNTNVAAARWTDFVPKPRGRPDGVRHSSTWTSMGLVTRAHGRRPGPRALRPRGHHPPAA